MNPALEGAIAALTAMAPRKGRPTRQEARPILLEIGSCLLGGLKAEALEARDRLGSLPSWLLEAWRAAVLDELSMAATEHVRSADPRHLGHADYDWEYTLQARERLEDRLVAATFLGIDPGSPFLEGIRRADRIIREHLPRSGKYPPESAAGSWFDSNSH